MILTSRLGRAGRLVHAAVSGGAETSVLTLGRLKGGAHKLGQTLALVSDSMPAELRARLGGLFSEAEPRPWEEVAPMIAALPDGVVSEVERVPFAAASLGQVHGARLADGRDGVVKVLYPGVAGALQADLDNLQVAALPARWVSGGAQMLTGLRGALLAELDLRVEAKHAAAMARALQPWPRLRVAEPVYASEQVLVSARLWGPTLHAALRPQGPGPDHPREVAEDLVAAVLGPVFSAGLVNADAHPGNLILMPDGLGLVDFGAVSPILGVPQLHHWLDRALEGHHEGVLAGLGIDAGPLEPALRVMLGPLRRGEWDFSNDTLLAELGEIKRRQPLALRRLPFAPDRLPLIRALMGLYHALRRLEVRFPLGEVLARVRAQGLASQGLAAQGPAQGLG